jgi:putative tryptophan/tyrosine transport system substrate-binding protein
MNRRDTLLSLCALLAAGRPVASYAQPQAKAWRIGVLQPGSPPEPLLEAQRESLRELGYVEGRDIVFDIRWAEGNSERLNSLAAELVAAKVDLIVTFSTPAAIAARRATATIPIVFTGVGDPVGVGVVSSLARPGGNVTGMSTLATELSGKRLEILREIVPDLSPLAMLWNDRNPSMVIRARESQDAANKLGVTIKSLGVHELVDFDAAFAAIRNGRFSALFTLADPFTREHRKRITDLAAQLRLPAIYEIREFVDAGGLISYGPNLRTIHRRSAIYIDRILKGAKPADLPVELPTTFELIVNMKTAKALGIKIPQSVLLRADQVIE